MNANRVLIVVSLILASWTRATQPPTPAEVDAYLKDGSLAQRAEFVRQMGKHKVRPDVAQRTLSRSQFGGPPAATRAPSACIVAGATFFRH